MTYFLYLYINFKKQWLRTERLRTYTQSHQVQFKPNSFPKLLLSLETRCYQDDVEIRIIWNINVQLLVRRRCHWLFYCTCQTNRGSFNFCTLCRALHDSFSRTLLQSARLFVWCTELIIFSPNILFNLAWQRNLIAPQKKNCLQGSRGNQPSQMNQNVELNNARNTIVSKSIPHAAKMTAMKPLPSLPQLKYFSHNHYFGNHL